MAALAPVAAASPPPGAPPPSSLVTRSVADAKTQRLLAAAQAGSHGVAQFDAAQHAIGAEKSNSINYLLGQQRQGGLGNVVGLGGALSGAVSTGLSPYGTLLSNDKSQFLQNLAAGLHANTNYMDEVAAAEKPTLAAAKSGGGSGGGRGGSGGGSISNSALKVALIGAATQLRDAQLQAIGAQGAHDIAQASTDVTQHNTEQQTANTITARMRAENQWSGPGSAPAAGPSSPAPPVVSAPPATTTAPRAITDRIAQLQAEYNRLSHEASDVLPGQYQREVLMPPSEIIAQQIRQSPLFAQNLAQAGITPERIAGVLTPTVDASYVRGVKANLPKAAAVAAQPAGKRIPVPWEEAAQRAGITGKDAVRTSLGQTYLRDGYQAVDKNGKPVAYGTPDATYTDLNGRKVPVHQATSGVVDDLTSQAERAAKNGFGFIDFWTKVDASPFWNQVFQSSPTVQTAFKLAQAASRGFFYPTPARAAIPARPIIPSVPYLTSPGFASLGSY